jgi:hypothetical protein
MHAEKRILAGESPKAAMFVMPKEGVFGISIAG